MRPSFPTVKEAEDWEAEARAAVEAGRPIPTPGTGKAQGKTGPRSLATLGALFEHVKRTEWEHLRSARTALVNGRDVVNYFGTKREVASIGSEDIAEMMAHFTDSGLARATVNRKTTALSRMLHVAADAGIIPKVPKIKWRVELKTRFRYLDQMEEKVMLAFWEAQGDTDMRDLSVLLIDTGARCFSEMIPVLWDHFGPGYAAVTFWNTKSNQPRTVPVTKRCRDVLKRRRADPRLKRGPFTGMQDGGPAYATVNKNTMRDKWFLMRDTTGMHDVTPHTLRHTCCTRLVLGGVDIKRVMSWMGHSAISTTMRYMQIKPTALEDVLHVLEGKSA
jgi:integrase